MADDRPRNDSGQYNDRLAPERVLDVFDERDDRARPLTAGDVVEALDVSRRTALNKLNELVAAETLASRTVGARARVFWRPITDDTSETTESVTQDVADALDALDLNPDRRDAVRAMYDLLRERGTARKSVFTTEIYPEHSAGFGSEGGWWNALGKDKLGELPGVRKPAAEGSPTWRFDGPEGDE